MLKRIATDEHSRLLRYFLNYDRKNFYKISYSLLAQNRTQHTSKSGGLLLGAKHTPQGAYAMLVIVCENDFWLCASIWHFKVGYLSSYETRHRALYVYNVETGHVYYP